MKIVIKPQTDKYIDQIWGAVSKFLQLSKEKNPKLPKMEIILEGDSPSHDVCNHEFRVTDVSHDIVMIRCKLCHRVYHVEYSEESIGATAP